MFLFVFAVRPVALGLSCADVSVYDSVYNLLQRAGDGGVTAGGGTVTVGAEGPVWAGAPGSCCCWSWAPCARGRAWRAALEGERMEPRAGAATAPSAPARGACRFSHAANGPTSSCSDTHQ